MRHPTHPLALAMALGILGLGAGAVSTRAVAQQAMTQPQVQAKLAAKGYLKVHDVEFDDGMWKADAKSADGTRMELHVDAKTGQIYPDNAVSKLSDQDIRASLETQGYTHVHDVEFEDGMWQAKADNRAGKKVELKLDPADGKVIGTH